MLVGILTKHLHMNNVHKVINARSQRCVIDDTAFLGRVGCSVGGRLSHPKPHLLTDTYIAYMN
jgi:hypothetical protein